MATRKAQNIEVPADPEFEEAGIETTDQSPEAQAPAASGKSGNDFGRGTIDSPMDYDEAMRRYNAGELTRSTFTTRGWLAVAKPIPAQARV